MIFSLIEIMISVLLATVNYKNVDSYSIVVKTKGYMTKYRFGTIIIYYTGILFNMKFI